MVEEERQLSWKTDRQGISATGGVLRQKKNDLEATIQAQVKKKKKRRNPKKKENTEASPSQLSAIVMWQITSESPNFF